MIHLVLAIALAAGQAPSGTTTSNSLTWDASATATNYNVMRGVSGCGSFVGTFSLIATVNSLSYIDTNLNPGTVYSYYVTAKNSGGVSGPSNCVTMTTTPPPPPSGLVLTSK